MSNLKMPKINYDKFKNTGKQFTNQTVNYLKSHWIDHLLVFFILFVLGAFDIFILKRSDNFLSPEYWFHTGCRMVAYILAGILGVRIGYPKAKDACEELKTAFIKNRYLILAKELNSIKFCDFIAEVNLDIKASAWKSKILVKITKLDKRYPDAFPLYYRTEKIEIFDKFTGKRRARILKRLDNYCVRRKTLESLIDDNYIKENIQILNVKYPRINETDFTQTTGKVGKYKTYHTLANVKGNAAKMISTGLLISAIFSLLVGSFVLSIDEALLSERVSTIISIIVNAILDIGFTLGKFVFAIANCPRIVRQEDLRSILDQNELLIIFKKRLSAEETTEYEQTVEALKEEEKEELKN